MSKKKKIPIFTGIFVLAITGLGSPQIPDSSGNWSGFGENSLNKEKSDNRI
jgi:hypothetical protein